jgi:hypothetical protein
MGPGSHVGFPISTKNTNLVYDHPMNITAKFGSNLFVVSEPRPSSKMAAISEHIFNIGPYGINV